MTNAALIVDGLIVVVYFVTIATIGIRVGRRERTLEDYALGGRRIPWWAVMASIIAAETSAATFIGVPAEGYATRGLVYAQVALGYVLGRAIVGRLFLRPYFEYRVYTVYDFLAIRFGPKSRASVSFLFLVMRTLASGVRLYVPSLVLVLAWRLFVRHEAVQYGTLDSWVPYAWAIGLLTLVTFVYTAIGGIRAVIWTDLVQASLMICGALAAIVTLLCQIGGGDPLHGFTVLVRVVPEMASRQGYFLTGLESLPPDAGAWLSVHVLLEQKYTLPAALLGGTIVAMAAFGTDQDMVQRMLTATDYRRGRRSLMGSALLDVPVFAAFSLIGVLLVAFYDLHPQLRPARFNDVFGAYILTGMPPVLRGFLLAGLFATAMGSLSAALNALATSMTNDWYRPHVAPDREPGHYVTAARLFTGFFAAAMILVAVAFAYANVKNPGLTIIPVVLGVAGYILGPMLGVFLLGMLTRTRGSDAGNVVAVAAGLIAVFVLSGRLGDLWNWAASPGYALALPAWVPRIEFTWYPTIGAAVTLGIGLLFGTPADAIEAARRARSSNVVSHE